MTDGGTEAPLRSLTCSSDGRSRHEGLGLRCCRLFGAEHGLGGQTAPQRLQALPPGGNPGSPVQHPSLPRQRGARRDTRDKPALGPGRRPRWRRRRRRLSPAPSSSSAPRRRQGANTDLGQEASRTSGSNSSPQTSQHVGRLWWSEEPRNGTQRRATPLACPPPAVPGNIPNSQKQLSVLWPH